MNTEAYFTHIAASSTVIVDVTQFRSRIEYLTLTYNIEMFFKTKTC